MVRINDRTTSKDLGEYKILRNHRTEGTKEKRWREDDETREKLIYVLCAYCCMYIYRRVYFRTSDSRIGEKWLFASRHLVTKPAVLFTYLPPCRTRACYICRAPLSWYLAFLFAFSYSHSFSQTWREIANKLQ